MSGSALLGILGLLLLASTANCKLLLFDVFSTLTVQCKPLHGLVSNFSMYSSANCFRICRE